MTSTTSNPSITISSELDFAVDIYDVFNPDVKNPGPLTYTKIATIESGAKDTKVDTIRKACQLQAMRTGSIKALNGTFHNQFPVAVLAVTPWSKSSFTITKDMQESMEQTFRFIKYSTANAGSRITRNFVTALGDKENQTKSVDKFFASTHDFKKCTMSTWSAVCNWQAQFMSAWQGTYYLYCVEKTQALVATLSIVSNEDSCVATLVMDDTKQATELNMIGDGTFGEKEEGTGGLSVALTPVWMNIAQTNKDDKSTVIKYLIGAAFKGTINEKTVVGNLNQISVPSSSSDNTSNFGNLLLNWLARRSLEGIVGMITSILMVYYMAKGHKNAEVQNKTEAEGSAPDAAEANARSSRVEAEYQQDVVPQVEARVQEALPNAPNVQEMYRQMETTTELQMQQDLIQSQAVEMQERLSEGPASEATTNAATELSNAQKEIDKAAMPESSPNTREEIVNKVNSILKNTGKSLDEVLKNETVNRVSQEGKTLENAEKALKEHEKQSEAMEKNKKEQERKNENEGNEEIKEEDFNEPKVDANPIEFKPEIAI